MIAPRSAPALGNGFPLLLAALGLAVGAVVAGIVASYCRDLSFWPRSPWPRSPVKRLLLVQLVVSATFYGLAAQYEHELPLLVVGAVESVLLITLLFIDLDLRLVPTPLVGGLALLALGSADAWPGLGLGSALIGGALGIAGFGGLAALGRLLFGEEALGIGDATLALAIGCLTGYPLVIGTLTLGIVFGGLAAGTVLVRRRDGLRGALPYGPALVAATLVVLIHGSTMHPFP